MVAIKHHSAERIEQINTQENAQQKSKDTQGLVAATSSFMLTQSSGTGTLGTSSGTKQNVKFRWTCKGSASN